MKYEYGPDIDFKITSIGDMLTHNGAYSNLNEKTQYLLQTLCHVVYQIKKAIQTAPNGLLWINNDVGMHWIHEKDGDHYFMYTKDMMNGFHVIETGYHAFDFEFVSPNQLMRADSLLDYAYNDVVKNGRAS